MNAYEPRVAGESAQLLAEVIRSMEKRPSRNGLARYLLKVDPKSRAGIAYNRAWARMIGRLTAADALIELETGRVPRTEKERRYDAFFELIKETAEAVTAMPAPTATTSGGYWIALRAGDVADGGYGVRHDW